MKALIEGQAGREKISLGNVTFIDETCYGLNCGTERMRGAVRQIAPGQRIDSLPTTLSAANLNSRYYVTVKTNLTSRKIVVDSLASAIAQASRPGSPFRLGDFFEKIDTAPRYLETLNDPGVLIPFDREKFENKLGIPQEYRVGHRAQHTRVWGAS